MTAPLNGMPDPVEAPREVDSWRFLPPRLGQVLRSQLATVPDAVDIPFVPLAKPLRAARVALLSTAGISRPPDPSFDMEAERANPRWGDPSWRRIPLSSTSADVEVNHLHIDARYNRRDLNVALPLARLGDLVSAGQVGDAAPTHYSLMGYQPDQTVQLRASAPAIAASMRAEGVDAAVLAPV